MKTQAVATGPIEWALLRLLTSCPRKPRHRPPPRREWKLPPGCVLAVRYSSR